MPTREERERLASLVESAAYQAEQSGFPGVAVRLNDAAAELRRTCATCICFYKWALNSSPVGRCSGGLQPENFNDYVSVPADGSGFCHRWESKFPATPANTEAVK